MTWRFRTIGGLLGWEHHKTVSWLDDPILALPAVSRLWPSDDDDDDEGNLLRMVLLDDGCHYEEDDDDGHSDFVNLQKETKNFQTS